MKFLAKLDGYKTYCVALAMLFHAVIIFGWQQKDWNSAWVEARTALAIGGFRSALKK